MKYRMFTYSISGDGELSDLNAFLSSHRILDVKLHHADEGRRVVFVIEYMDSGSSSKSKKPPRVDYREKLSEGQFEVFSQLRDLRKRIAEEEGVPVYTVFTNAQLAEMVQKKINDKSGMQEIAGVGESKIKKYGARFIDVLRDLEGRAK